MTLWSAGWISSRGRKGGLEGESQFPKWSNCSPQKFMLVNTTQNIGCFSRNFLRLDSLSKSVSLQVISYFWTLRTGFFGNHWTITFIVFHCAICQCFKTKIHKILVTDVLETGSTSQPKWLNLSHKKTEVCSVQKWRRFRVRSTPIMFTSPMVMTWILQHWRRGRVELLKIKWNQFMTDWMRHLKLEMSEFLHFVTVISKYLGPKTPCLRTVCPHVHWFCP